MSLRLTDPCCNLHHSLNIHFNSTAMNNPLRFFLLVSFVSSAALAASDKVSFDIYYETLCPFCSNLIVNYLYKLFDYDLISITDLRLLPYGNAKIGSDGTIHCQHGPDECLLNTVEACAIHSWPDVKDHFPFVYCVEKLVYHHNYTNWESCFKTLNLDASPVVSCLNNGVGKELELGYAAVTSSLDPPHKYVPWVVVDGQPIYDDYVDFVSYICKAYKGSEKPYACTASMSESRWFHKVKAKLLHYLRGEYATWSMASEAGQTVVTWARRVGAAAA